jgi:LDH2 family malate/lactate/ureidoglycolate dehydrogenase
VIVDFATTVVAGGKIAAARDAGEPIPEGWILTKDGQPTTDPNEFSEGGMLLPMGGHKGFGLSMVAEALGGALTGATRFEAGERSRNCLLMWGIEIGAFQPAEEYRMLEDRSISKVKATPPAPGFNEVLIPGERGRRVQQAREHEGVWVPDRTWRDIRSTAEQLGVLDLLPPGAAV